MGDYMTRRNIAVFVSINSGAVAVLAKAAGRSAAKERGE
jgi:hypothetical protein